jgi:hypothetical protein
LKKQVDQYKLEKISSRMSKDFGTIKKGDEESYGFMLQPMEGNLLKLHRKDPAGNGRRAIEAIHICLMKIDGYINGIEYDFGKFITDENKALTEGLLMSFDPFTNQEIFSAVSQIYDLKSSEGLREYFTTPVKCLLRIEKSIEMWSGERGVNGYFDFMEEHIGTIIENDDKMDYTIELKNSYEFNEDEIDASVIDKYLPQELETTDE